MTLQAEILKALTEGKNTSELLREFENDDPRAKSYSRSEIFKMLWALVAKRFVYLEMNYNSSAYWDWVLTDKGKGAAIEQEFNPDDPEWYLQNLQSKVTDIETVVFSYAKEAVYSYYNECYLASAVMLGVASEAAFLGMISSGKDWLEIPEKKFQDILNSKKMTYGQKLKEFGRYFQLKKASLPDDIKESYSLLFDSLADIYKVTRNDAGHYTGKNVERGDQYTALFVFPRYLQRMYELKNFFIFHSKNLKTT